MPKYNYIVFEYKIGRDLTYYSRFGVLMYLWPIFNVKILTEYAYSLSNTQCVTHANIKAASKKAAKRPIANRSLHNHILISVCVYNVLSR